MTTTPTLDIAETVRQVIALAEAGCEIVRITAQNVAAARALGTIKARLNAAKVTVPLVADIHFLPAAAIEAAEHVEKVRINPGNYADKKKFQVLEYSDALYAEELDRLYAAFTPIVLKCKELGRAMRIGTNHGSLSDRIMNRYGDTPEGMVESALEFIRIAESHGFHDIVLSMKASNPKIVIQAYRLLVSRMDRETLPYPLHLGVTEAGDGDDARIKSAIGIGSLLWDGLGDTIRVSLTEDPVYEIPIAKDLARKAEALWAQHAEAPAAKSDTACGFSLFDYNRRSIRPVHMGAKCTIGTTEPPRVIIASPRRLSEASALRDDLRAAHRTTGEARVEGLFFADLTPEELVHLPNIRALIDPEISCYVFDVTNFLLGNNRDALENHPWSANDFLLCDVVRCGVDACVRFLDWSERRGLQPVLNVEPSDVARLPASAARAIYSAGPTPDDTHPVGHYRALVSALHRRGWDAPIWIRNNPGNTVDGRDYFTDRLLDAAILSGSLLCDGIGDLISVEHEPSLARSLSLTYSVLQGARARSTRTEFVACPSCGRTLFDLQTTTQRIRERTGHLKGVTIAVMGCIVNGPGEMADADFGYVGGAPGKVNLYVGKACVQYHIPADKAVDRLVELIQEHGKWRDPDFKVETPNDGGHH